MKGRWLIPVACLLAMHSYCVDGQQGRVTTVSIDPGAINPLHLHFGFESVIHLPEEVTSVVVGSPAAFHVEHSEAEPTFVYVKPTGRVPIQSDLLIAMKSGQHVVLQLVSEGDGSGTTNPVDFLVEFQSSRKVMVVADVLPSEGLPSSSTATSKRKMAPIDVEFAFQEGISSPIWTTWEGQRFKTSIGDIRQIGNQTLVAFSILNASDHAVELVPPQIQMDGAKPKKKAETLLSDQLEIRAFRMSSSRLESGARADGVLLFDRPNFKSSTDTLFLQLAQADQVDHPILVKLPFTPPSVSEPR